MITFSALILSLGVGYELDTIEKYESNPWKGMLQLEYVLENFSIGYLHTSRTQDGFEGTNFDQNLIYIKKDFKL